MVVRVGILPARRADNVMLSDPDPETSDDDHAAIRGITNATTYPSPGPRQILTRGAGFIRHCCGKRRVIDEMLKLRLLNRRKSIPLGFCWRSCNHHCDLRSRQ